MTEDTLNFAAIGIELGVPVLLLLGCWLLPKKRLIFTTALIAISPMLMAYMFISINHHPGQTDFAFAAMWLMTFVVYMALLTIGLVVGLIRHKVAKRAISSPAA